MSRVSVRAHLKTMLTQALKVHGVQVILGSSINDIPHEGVWLFSPETSPIEVDKLAGSGRVIRDDIWEMEIRVVTARPNNTSPEDAETRLQELYDQVEAVIVDEVQLTSETGALSLIPARLQGPITAPQAEGNLSAYYLTVEVHERRGP